MILSLLPGSETSHEQQQRATEWLSEPAPRSVFSNLAIDLPLRSGQIRWRNKRAVVQSPSDQSDDISAAISAFAWIWMEFERVQEKHEISWIIQSEDAGAVSRFGFGWAEGRRISQMAVDAKRDRQWFLRATIALERGELGLTKNARRIFFELCHQLEMSKRLVLMGEMIECREDIYEHASDRVFEFRLFIFSTVIEAAILLGIIVEVVLLMVSTAE